MGFCNRLGMKQRGGFISGYLYAGLHTSPGKVVKIATGSMMKVAAITLDPNFVGPEALKVNGQYLFVGCYYLVAPPHEVVVLKIDLAAMAIVAYLATGYFDPDMTYGIEHDGTYLYVPISRWPLGEVIKVDPTTMTSVASLTLNPGEEFPDPLVHDGTYLYVGLDTFPGMIVKIDPATMTKITTLTLAVGEDEVVQLIYDGTYLYAGLSTFPGMVVKIDPATMTEIATLTLDVGEDQVIGLTHDGTYLYACLFTSPGKIVKINPATMTKITTLTLDAGEDVEAFNQLTNDGTYVYAGLVTAPGKVVKIDPATMTKVETLTLDTGEDNLIPLIYVSG